MIAKWATNATAPQTGVFSQASKQDCVRLLTNAAPTYRFTGVEYTRDPRQQRYAHLGAVEVFQNLVLETSRTERACVRACEIRSSSSSWAGASPRARSIKTPWELAAVAPSRSRLRRSQWRPRQRAKAVGTLATAAISLGGGRSSTLPTGNHGTALRACGHQLHPPTVSFTVAPTGRTAAAPVEAPTVTLKHILRFLPTP